MAELANNAANFSQEFESYTEFSGPRGSRDITYEIMNEDAAENGYIDSCEYRLL